ncbi:MAG: hypothetical protein GX127_08945 [Eubacteriaceae bacterium]|nr:hypothetical protein [Eubacteriaceae bacterium]
MRKRWLIIALVLALVMATVPGTFAQEPEVIDGNTFANYQKTQQEIADRYNGIFEDAPGYEDLYETPQVIDTSGGLLNQTYLDKILEGINYFRWLYGAPEIASIATNQDLADFSLVQAYRLKEGPGLAHKPESKPAGLSGMSDDRWAEISGENALAFHNIIAGANDGMSPGSPPTGKYGKGIKSWINEGKAVELTNHEKVIGHREALLDPSHNRAAFGAATVPYTKNKDGKDWNWVAEAQSAYVVNDGAAVAYEQDFYAMPAPGNFPYNELVHENAAWTVYLNPNEFSSDQNTTAQIYVTNPNGSREEATNTSGQVQYADHFKQTITFEPSNVSSFDPGEYKVEIEGLNKNGTPVAIHYTVVLFDRTNPAADESPEPTVESISVAPTELEVQKGTALDALKNEITVTAIMSDGTEKTLEAGDYTLSGDYDGETAGDYTLTVTYSEQTATLGVHVQEETQTPTRTLTGITLDPDTETVDAKSMPSKFKVIATYSDDSTETYDSNQEGISITNFDNEVTGEQNATVQYTENDVTKEAILRVTVNPVFDGIVVDPSTLTVEKGTETLPITVRGMYDGQVYEGLAPDKVKIIGYDKDTLGEQDVTVKYDTSEATIHVTVEEGFVKTLTGISATLEKSQIEQYEDMPALTVKAQYNDNTEETLTADAYEVSGFDNTVVDTQTITVTLKEDPTKTDTVTLNVTEPAKKITSIDLSLSENPVPLGSHLADVLQIIVKYDDGTQENLSVEDVTVTGYDPETAGNQTITVSYRGESANIDITVMEKLTELVDETTGVKLTATGDGDFAGLTLVVIPKDQDSQTFKEASEKLSEEPSFNLANLYDIKLKKGDDFIAYNQKVIISLPLGDLTPDTILGIGYFPTDENEVEIFEGETEASHYTAAVDHLSLFGLIQKTKSEPKVPTLTKITAEVSGQKGNTVVVAVGQDLPELVVTAYYDNGTKKILGADAYTVNPAYDRDTKKPQTLKITHEGKSTTLKVVRPQKSGTGTGIADTQRKKVGGEQGKGQETIAWQQRITRVIRSGDTSPVIIVGILLGLSVIGLIATIVLRRKK